jgi:hypothetical protein
MPYEDLVKVTKEEIAEGKRKCWSTECKHTALIENHSGYRYCIKHHRYYRKYDGGYFTKIRKILWSNIFK